MPDAAPTPNPSPSPDCSAGGNASSLPEQDPDVVVEMFSQPRLLSGSRAMVDQLARRLGFDEAVAGQISLAIDEAICNVINHGYKKRTDGRIRLHLWALEPESAAPEVVVLLEDRGETVDPDSIRGRDLDDIRPGGLGVHIMREVMDLVHYEARPGGGMRLIMRKRRSDADDGAAKESK